MALITVTYTAVITVWKFRLQTTIDTAMENTHKQNDPMGNGQVVSHHSTTIHIPHCQLINSWSVKFLTVTTDNQWSISQCSRIFWMLYKFLNQVLCNTCKVQLYIWHKQLGLKCMEKNKLKQTFNLGLKIVWFTGQYLLTSSAGRLHANSSIFLCVCQDCRRPMTPQVNYSASDVTAHRPRDQFPVYWVAAIWGVAH